jgi:hypothetical protein
MIRIPLQTPSTEHQQPQKNGQKNHVSGAAVGGGGGGGEEEDEVTALATHLGLAAASSNATNISSNISTISQVQATASCPTLHSESAVLLHKASPLLFLRYLYLYVDPTSDPDKDINNQDPPLEPSTELLDIVSLFFFPPNIKPLICWL